MEADSVGDSPAGVPKNRALTGEALRQASRRKKSHAASVRGDTA
jgi:hypothetical protein